MKKLITLALLSLSYISTACWFTELNFNSNYIASVNNSVIHYFKVSNIDEAVYYNNRSAALPLTVQIKVSDKLDTVGNTTISRPIIKAVLQYKIVRLNGSQTEFKTIKSLDNPVWKLNFNTPVDLFGKYSMIDVPNSDISAGDSIIIRVYLSDGIYQTGDLNSDIKLSDIPDECSKKLNNISIGLEGWTAPFVVRVIYNGKRRVII